MYAPIFVFPLTCVYRLVANPIFTARTRPYSQAQQNDRKAIHIPNFYLIYLIFLASPTRLSLPASTIFVSTRVAVVD